MLVCHRESCKWESDALNTPLCACTEFLMDHPPIGSCLRRDLMCGPCLEGRFRDLARIQNRDIYLEKKTNDGDVFHVRGSLLLLQRTSLTVVAICMSVR